MSVAVFIGILAITEALHISSNETLAENNSSFVSVITSEPEETTSYDSLEEEDDALWKVTPNQSPPDSSFYYEVNGTSLPETNGTAFSLTDDSLFYLTNTTILPELNGTLIGENNKTVIINSNVTVYPVTTLKTFVINTTLTSGQNSSEILNVTSTGQPDSSSANVKPTCPDIGIPQYAGSVIKCRCKGNEILVDGKCEIYHGVTVIPVQRDWIYTDEVNVKNYTVTIQGIDCDPSKYRSMTFTKRQFHLRPRGDMVLLQEAGDLEGQRVNNYCIVHHLDEYGDLTWTMKTCVPIPNIPRCCPFREAMIDGKCQKANTPLLLEPPISAKPFSDAVAWPEIQNYHSPLKCDYEPLTTIPLGYKQSTLVSLANGVGNGWVPGDTDKRREYYFCPNYCIDGIKNSDGSVKYYSSFCYKNPIEAHKEACAEGTCLRKCCKYGYSMDKNRYSCVPDPNSTFIPPTETALSDYNIVIGWPLCTPVSKVDEKISVDRTGNLILKDRVFTSSDFCVDTFLDNEQRQQGAMACLLEISLWLDVRPYLFPICNIISLTFLVITIVSHLLVPKLLANGGLHQLCHVIALSIAYTTSFSVHVFHNFFTDETCINMAIAMQFGFLTTFFWLNVMCFEIWRKIRRLKNYRPCKSYPNAYYLIYGWGIPSCICIVTIIMQKFAPDNVWGVIKPYIGVSRCWFKEDGALFVYFYGIVAALFLSNSVFLFLTYINYKIMLQNYKETTNDLKNLGTGVISDQRNMSSSMPSRQITDHVHDFNQKLKIFILMATCWVTEVLSWKIPPIELWSVTDTLNSLQGFFLFIILLSNSNKRKHLEEKYPRLFSCINSSNNVPANLKSWLQNSMKFSLSPVSSITSSISKKFPNSTVLTTLSNSFRASTPSSSFKVNSTPSSTEVQSSVSQDDLEKGVVVLSHSTFQSSDSKEDLVQPSSQDSKTPEVNPDSSC